MSRKLLRDYAALFSFSFLGGGGGGYKEKKKEKNKNIDSRESAAY